MVQAPGPGELPRQRIQRECDRRGVAAVAADCAAMLAGREADPQFVLMLGGVHAEAVLAGREQPYWPRVWAARGLLWAWHDTALPALRTAAADEAWRVREMAAKVVARHLVLDALPEVARLQRDPVPRVRQAAARALVRLTAEAGRERTRRR